MNKEIMELLAPVTPEEKRILDGRAAIDRNLYMHNDSDVVIAKKLLEGDRIITLRKHTRFTEFPEHTHDFIEVIYMCRGTTTHIVNGDKIVLSEGELLFLGQNTRQMIMPAGENDIAVNFIIMPAFFDTVLDMLGKDESPLRSFLVDSLKDGSEDGSYLYFKVANLIPVQNLIENLIYSLLCERENKRSINGITMGLLFLELINHTEKLEYKNKKEERLMRVFRYIEEHYRDGELTELANILHYDFSWLSREIKKRTGKTYTELVREKRLSKAADFLRSSSLKISDIASDMGYANLSYFHRIFKEKYGVTPAKYRKQYRESGKDD